MAGKAGQEVDTGQTMYWKGLFTREGDAESDRCGYSVDAYQYAIAGDNESATWTNKAGGAGTGTYTEWDD